MWLFTKLGFYSVVRHREDSSSVIVRARLEQDAVRLSNLMKRHNLPHIAIVMPDADYRYRLGMSAATWHRVAQLLAADIDYPNFKSMIHTQGDPARDRAYGDIWWRMVQLQAQQALRAERSAAGTKERTGE